ncbi:MAG: right-handed parallel beta-helix repeat-containing protein [Bacteroidota bacterium]|nr:right-handed parallel beta-helix repeat-containing protein [Bacteroidota bacterium]
MKKNLFILFIFLFLINKANSTIYYVSDSGNDLNPGTTQLLPWQSVSKVNSMMSLFRPGDQILFERGDSFLGPLNIAKSGTAGNYLTFGSYGSGNLPVISGKKAITGWNLYSGNIYSAYVGDTVSAVYVSDKIMTIARYPDSGFLRTDYSGGNTGFYDAALTQPVSYWNGATCRIRTINWNYEIRTVSNFSGGNVTFSSNTAYSGYTNYGYYFDNKLNLLDAEGEWYYDIATGYLYFHAPNSVDPNTLLTEAVTVRHCIYGNLQSNYVKIMDLKISGSRHSGIEFPLGYDDIIIGCYINHTGIYGIRINGTNDVIENSTFEDNLNTAITGVITNGVVKNNIINRTGLIAGYGQGGNGYRAMTLNVCQGTIVELNNIDSSGYSGMTVAKNMTVRNNVIDYSCLVLNDGAGIEITNCDTLKILNNIISNTIGNYETSSSPFSYACGIYVNGAIMKNTTIQGNTLSNNRYTGILVDHKNTPANNKIIGNVCYNNYIAQIIFTDYSAVNFVPVYNTIVNGNIFYSLSTSQNCMEQRGYSSSGISDYGIFDSNYYCNPYSEILIKRTTFLPTYVTNFYSLPIWKTNFGEDLNSRSLPFSFSQFAVTDTLSSNLISNSTFTTNVNGWNVWPQGLTIAHVIHPLLNNGSMRLRWNGDGFSQGFTLSNFYPITTGYNYLVSLSCVGNNSGVFNLWGSIPGSLATFPQTFFSYENYKKDYSLIFKADTTDPNARLSIGLKLPDSLLFVDNVNVYRVALSKIDSTQMSKIFVNQNNYAASFSLEGIPYKDLDGNPVTGSILIPAYSSEILVNENYLPSPKNLQLKVFMQGLYNVSLNSSISDTVKICLRNSSSPYAIIDSSKAVVDPAGNGSFIFPIAQNSVGYYLVTNHRNTIETWSKLPITFVSNTLSYDFTTSANKAYGDNLILRGTKYCIYSGDIDQDDFVDLADYSIADNAANNYLTGYSKEDINGDGIVDLADMSFVDNNAANYVATERP